MQWHAKRSSLSSSMSRALRVLGKTIRVLILAPVVLGLGMCSANLIYASYQDSQARQWCDDTIADYEHDPEAFQFDASLPGDPRRVRYMSPEAGLSGPTFEVSEGSFSCAFREHVVRMFPGSHRYSSATGEWEYLNG